MKKLTELVSGQILQLEEFNPELHNRTRGIGGGLPNLPIYVMPYMRRASYKIGNETQGGNVALGVYKSENGSYQIITVPMGTFTRSGRKGDITKPYAQIHAGCENLGGLHDTDAICMFKDKVFAKGTSQPVIFPVFVNNKPQWKNVDESAIEAKNVVCRSLTNDKAGYTAAFAAFEVWLEENGITKESAGYYE